MDSKHPTPKPEPLTREWSRNRADMVRLVDELLRNDPRWVNRP